MENRKLIIQQDTMLWKLIISFLATVIIFLDLLALLLGELYKDKLGLIILLSVALIIIVAAFLTYFLIRKFTKTHYVFDDKGIHETCNGKEKLFIQWANIYQLIYPRVWWIFLLQFGSGQLTVRYINESSEQKQHQVSFSLKEIKLIAKTFNRNIIIK